MSTTRFSISASGKAKIEKDPDAVLDYAFLWSSWLAVGETIQSQVTEVVNLGVTGFVQSAFVHQGTSVIVFVAGGLVGELLEVRCRIATSAGRIDDRTVYVKVKSH